MSTNITQGISLAAADWDRLVDLAEELECLSIMGSRPGCYTAGALMRDIAAGDIRLTRIRPPRQPLTVRVQALLDRGGMTHTEIARSVDCSLSLVSKVASGVRGGSTLFNLGRRNELRRS